jgi:hypothetical protein
MYEYCDILHEVFIYNLHLYHSLVIRYLNLHWSENGVDPACMMLFLVWKALWVDYRKQKFQYPNRSVALHNS